MKKYAEGSLLKQTRKLLEAQRGRYLDIYEATRLPPNWLSLLAHGKIKDPSVNKVQCLYEHLTNKKLGL